MQLTDFLGRDLMQVAEPTILLRYLQNAKDSIDRLMALRPETELRSVVAVALTTLSEVMFKVIEQMVSSELSHFFTGKSPLFCLVPYFQGDSFTLESLTKLTGVPPTNLVNDLVKFQNLFSCYYGIPPNQDGAVRYYHFPTLGMIHRLLRDGQIVNEDFKAKYHSHMTYWTNVWLLRFSDPSTMLVLNRL